MKVPSLLPSPESRVEFSFAQVRHVPAQTGCYVLASFDDWVLYAGQGNLVERFDAHLKDPTRRESTPWGKVFWFYYLPCNRAEMSHIEGGWTNEFKLAHGGKLPHFNKINPPS